MSFEKQRSFSDSIQKDLKPLDQDKIFRAKDLIVELHPLCQTELGSALPFLRPVLRLLCFNKQSSTVGEDHISEALLEKDIDTDEPLSKMPSLKKKRTYVDKLKENLRVSGYHRKGAKNFQDPFIKYGYGVVAFFDLMKALICLFAVLSLLALPTILYYKEHSAISSYFGLAQTTMGNLGSSRALCIQAPLEHDKLEINCNNQKISKIVATGILPSTALEKAKRKCQFNNQLQDDQCYQFYGSNLMQKVSSTCLDQGKCVVQNYRKTLSQSEGNSCLDDDALFFAQVVCETKPEELNEIRHIGLLGVCLGMFMCLLYCFVIQYKYHTNELDFIIWDLETVTINDYTVDLELNQKLYYEYDQFRQNTPIQEGQTLHQHVSEFLKHLIETHISEYALKQNKKELVSEDKLKIMMMEFDFQRGGLIKLMIERGLHIKKLNFKKRRDTEARINKFKLRNTKELENPCRVFVTFEYTEGHNLFVQMLNDQTTEDSKPYKGLNAESAPTPTNIIWQQRNQTRMEWLSKRLFSILFIFLILGATMFGVFFIRRWGSRGVEPFKNQNCSWVYSQYGDTLPKYAMKAYEEEVEYFESIFNQNIEQEDLNLITCFCIKHDPSIFYSRFRSRFNLKINSTASDLDPQQDNMCQKFEMNYLSAEAINYFSSQTIVMLNFVLRYVVIFVVKFIGYDTESKQTLRIMVFVFIIQFINTDLIILLMNADLSQSGWPWFLSFNKGRHPDFTVFWYKDIGLTLINAMVFNIYWPVLEFIGFYCLRLFFRQLDRGLSISSWKTRAKTIQQYVDIYSGPEYMIHYKYSAVLNITFITFMFGAGMPILFPIAFLSFITLYVVERLMVAYSYLQPPMFDESLNRLTIRILMFAPLLYTTVGYWMFNNIQIFSTEVYTFKTLNQNIQTGHTILHAFEFNFASPLLLMTVIFLLLAVTRRWTLDYINKIIGLDLEIYKYKPEEQVSFIHALNKEQRIWIIKEEMKAREKFGIAKLSDEFIEKLETTPYNKHTELLGVMTYQILDNPIYQKLFQYVPEVLDNRDKYIFDDWQLNSLGQSDYVKKNLNAFYISNQLKEQHQNQ